jgi:sugar/nucleoside kinase (ribokinase family)
MPESKSIVIVGSVALDTIETPWGSAADCLGGSASYASLAASFFAPTRMVGIVGSDFPDSACRLFAEHGVDLEGLEIVEGKTFRWGGRYPADMNRRDTLFTHLNVFEDFHPKLPPSYRDSEIVLLANIHPSLQMEVLDQVGRPHYTALDTMNLWIHTALDSLRDVLKRVDLLFVNDEEARQLSGEEHLLKAVRVLQEMGPRHVVVKKGEHGALLFTDEDVFATCAVLLERVFDPTGAGDAFAGAFLGHLARDGRIDASTLRQAMVYATVTASFATEHFGADRLVEATDEAIERRVSALHRLTQWPQPQRMC